MMKDIELVTWSVLYTIRTLSFPKKLIAVTESSFKTLKESKRIREELGGENLHYEQSIKIPNHDLLYTRPDILRTENRVGCFGTICDQTKVFSVFVSLSR